MSPSNFVPNFNIRKIVVIWSHHAKSGEDLERNGNQICNTVAPLQYNHYRNFSILSLFFILNVTFHLLFPLLFSSVMLIPFPVITPALHAMGFEEAAGTEDGKKVPIVVSTRWNGLRYSSTFVDLIMDRVFRRYLLSFNDWIFCARKNQVVIFPASAHQRCCFICISWKTADQRSRLPRCSYSTKINHFAVIVLDFHKPSPKTWQLTYGVRSWWRSRLS